MQKNLTSTLLDQAEWGGHGCATVDVEQRHRGEHHPLVAVLLKASASQHHDALRRERDEREREKKGEGREEIIIIFK